MKLLENVLENAAHRGEGVAAADTHIGTVMATNMRQTFARRVVSR